MTVEVLLEAGHRAVGVQHADVNCTPVRVERLVFRPLSADRDVVDAVVVHVADVGEGAPEERGGGDVGAPVDGRTDGLVVVDSAVAVHEENVHTLVPTATFKTQQFR